MKTQSIDATLFASEHPNITKRTRSSGIIFSALLIMVGIAALLSAGWFEQFGSAMTIVLMLSGVIAILYGVLQLVWKNKEVVYEPTGSIAKEKSFFFDLRYLDALEECVSKGSFPVNSEIKSEPNGNIRMDVILSEDKQFAAVQLFQFVPYAYNPITSVHYYTNGEATSLSAFVAENGFNQ